MTLPFWHSECHLLCRYHSIYVLYDGIIWYVLLEPFFICDSEIFSSYLLCNIYCHDHEQYFYYFRWSYGAGVKRLLSLNQNWEDLDTEWWRYQRCQSCIRKPSQRCSSTKSLAHVPHNVWVIIPQSYSLSFEFNERKFQIPFSHFVLTHFYLLSSYSCSLIFVLKKPMKVIEL